MTTTLVALIGAAGLIAVEASYVPQLVRLYRRKRSDDISPNFPALNVFGRILALVYASMRGVPMFTVSLIVGVTLRGAFLVLVLRYRSRHRGLLPDLVATAASVPERSSQ